MGGTICTLLAVDTCLIHRPGLSALPSTCTTYRPSGEMAARLAAPVFVRRRTTMFAKAGGALGAERRTYHHPPATARTTKAATAKSDADHVRGAGAGSTTVWMTRLGVWSRSVVPVSRSPLSDRRSFLRSLAV